MDKIKYNWVLFSYNGNDTVARLIVNATYEQLSEFMDQGGNQDDPERWLFGDSTDTTAVCVGQDNINELRNSNHLVYVDNGYQRLASLPGWYVDYDEYPEGKIVMDKLSVDGEMH